MEHSCAHWNSQWVMHTLLAAYTDEVTANFLFIRSKESLFCQLFICKHNSREIPCTFLSLGPREQRVLSLLKCYKAHIFSEWHSYTSWASGILHSFVIQVTCEDLQMHHIWAGKLMPIFVDLLWKLIASLSPTSLVSLLALCGLQIFHKTQTIAKKLDIKGYRQCGSITYGYY